MKPSRLLIANSFVSRVPGVSLVWRGKRLAEVISRETKEHCERHGCLRGAGGKCVHQNDSGDREHRQRDKVNSRCEATNDWMPKAAEWSRQKLREGWTEPTEGDERWKSKKKEDEEENGDHRQEWEKNYATLSQIQKELPCSPFDEKSGLISL